MRVRFQADADLNHLVVVAILRRDHRVDFQSAQGVLQDGLSDAEVLRIAAEQHRVLVTHDKSTMPGHFATFVAGSTSAGVIVVPRRLSIRAVAEELLLIWQEMDADEWTNRICYLPL